MATSSTKVFSLVKYDTPILVSKSFGKNKASSMSQNTSTTTSASSIKSNEMKTAEDYLNSILPPREY